MSIQHTKTIDSIRIINDDRKIVHEVDVTISSFGDSALEDTQVTLNTSYLLSVDSIDETSNDFIEYENLTPELIFSWIELSNESRIHNILNPPKPKYARLNLPWN
jgi:hypothetical protein